MLINAMLTYHSSELDLLRDSVREMASPYREIVLRLLFTVDTLNERVRLKDDALISGLAAVYLSDNMQDEKIEALEQMESALESDSMEYSQRAETLAMLYSQVDTLTSIALTPQNYTKHLQPFLQRIERLKKEDDPLMELKREFKNTIGAMQYHEGFQAGLELERQRVINLLSNATFDAETAKMLTSLIEE